MSAAPPRRPFILAVDDDPAMHDTYELIFSETDYEFLGVRDGERALEVLASRPAGVVLLDLLMPRGMEGLDVLRRIKAIRPTTNVIVVSVVDQAGPAMECVRLGAMDYLTKPFEEDHLQLLVLQAIAQTADAEGATSPVATPPWVLIVGESLGVRATLATVLRNCCMVRVVKTVAEAARAFARIRPDLMIADVVAGTGASEDFFRELQTHFTGVPLIWIASPSQWAPLVRDQSSGSPNAVFRTPLDYGRLLGETANLLCLERVPLFRKPGRVSGLVITNVSEHFADTSVEDIAEAVRLSPGHLWRVFRDETGMRPKDFLTRVQLEAAKCLLKETEEKVEEIALRVGLCDGPHLARLLRHYDRRTPREYRLPDRPD